MQTLLRHEVLNHVVSVVVLIRPVVAVVGRADRDLASQIRRAMSSVGLNVAEGFGTQKGNSRLRFETARGSLYEVHAGLALAVAWGYVSADEIAPIDAALDRLGGRIYGLERRLSRGTDSPRRAAVDAARRDCVPVYCFFESP